MEKRTARVITVAVTLGVPAIGASALVCSGL